MPRNRLFLNDRLIGVIYNFFLFLLRVTADRVENNIDVSGISGEHNSSPLNDGINSAVQRVERSKKMGILQENKQATPFLLHLPHPATR